MKVRVYHEGYGCDTGCCGHVVELDGEQVGRFEFGHADKGREREFAIKLAKKKIGEEHPECLDKIDWSSIEIDVRDHSG